VQNKQKAAQEVGIECIIHRLPENAPQNEVIALIEKLNKETHGILLQLPVPAHLDKFTLLNAIDYTCDVDGLNLINVGRRTMEMDCLLPCTPKGCMTLIKSVEQNLTGLNAVVVGRSNLVGLPMAQLLLKENCTVTQAHIYTKNLSELCKTADILVVAIGDPQFIKGEWIKPGAIVIDVGINRVNDKIIGDVEFETAKNRVRAITPVPGGVGPMTIASLLENTLEVAEKSVV
jgi:methylenetetrahydrofolate dehydrogenase (NADP+)/methenyltetrahydrofolate cyclohydrolase